MMDGHEDYIARHVPGTVPCDGDLGKPAWTDAVWSHRFIDMVTGAPALFDTRAALLWTDTHLQIAFRAEEPFLEAHVAERDGIVFQDNDLELFIDGGDCYYELEVNALGTIYEVFFVWRDAIGQFDSVAFDVHDPRSFTFGGDYDRKPESFWRGTHPRGVRWAFTGWDMPGLQTAVRLDGTLNDHSDVDRGWSLEIAIPWASLAPLADGRQLPPASGDVWRMFLGRFQRLVLSGVEVTPHPASALNAHGVYDTHLPDRWSRIRFEQ